MLSVKHPRMFDLTPLISHTTVGLEVQGRHFCSGNGAGTVSVCTSVRVHEVAGEEVAIGVSYKISSLQLCGDLLDWGSTLAS